MKKFLIGLLTAALILCSCAVAELDRIDDRLFNTAKRTLHCLDTGDFQTASALLSFIDSDALKQFAADNFSTLGDGSAQTRISVAYACDGKWYLAVPTQQPASGVETLLLDCGSGSVISSMSEIDWKKVASALDKASMVIWNEEAGSNVVVISD